MNEKRRLPVLHAIEKSQFIRFEIATSTPASIAQIRAKLGTIKTIRVLFAFVWRSIFRDPLRTLPAPSTHDDWLTHRQLRPLLLLEDALTLSVGYTREEAFPTLREIVLASGTLFLSALMPTLEAADWIAADNSERDEFARGLVSRIFNARVSRVATSADSLAFDVASCRFADALRALHREHLGSLFCEVDAAYVSRKDSNLTLERSGTILRGASECDFKWRIRA